MLTGQLRVCVLFLTLTVLTAAVSCRGREEAAAPELEEITAAEENAPVTEESALSEDEREDAGITAAPQAMTSSSVQQPLSSLSAMSRRIQGLGVNVREIDPVNYENPDIDILRQMGAEQYLISFLEGEKYYREDDFDRAITEYTKSISSNSRFIEALVSRANAYVKKREFIKAIDDYSKAINLDSGRAELYNYRGFARIELSGAGNTASAIDDFSRAVSLNRNYVDALVNRSYAYYRSGNYEKAIEDCDRIIALEPANVAIWNRRGSCWYAREDDDRAIRDFSQALSINENYAAALYNRASAWYNKRDYDKAVADLNKCIALNPSYAAAYTSRGKIFEAQGNLESAAADFASAQRFR